MAQAEMAGGRWWGDQRLEVDEALVWQIGPLTLGVNRGRREWQVAYDWDAELEESDEWQLRRGAAFPEEAGHHERFVVGETGNRIRLEPALADRPVVSSPRVPFHLLPEREITLYVGSPVWVRLATEAPRATLRELPSQRPSDTWFGGSTREGMLCYATKTRALLNLENLPVPLLSLYYGEGGRLWTEGVVLTRSEESEMAALQVSSGPPAEADRAELVSPARNSAEPNLLIRAFNSLFGALPFSEEDQR